MEQYCPTCQRELKSVFDFPQIYVNDVAILKPEDVPNKLTGWCTEDVLEMRMKNWTVPLVPRKVLKYFRSHPQEKELLHTDNYVYSPPDSLVQEEYTELTGDVQIKRRPLFWKRTYNFSNDVKSILSSREVSNYFILLRKLKANKLPPGCINPASWKKERNEKYFKIPSSPNFSVMFSERGEFLNRRTSSLELMTSGPNLGSAGGETMMKLLDLATIVYEGRLK